MSNALSSTAQDIGRGKKTEIDSLNGYVARRGAVARDRNAGESDALRAGETAGGRRRGYVIISSGAADVAKLADALDLGSSSREGV